MQSPELKNPLELHRHLHKISADRSPLRLSSTVGESEYNVWVGFTDPEDAKSPVSLAIRHAAQTKGLPSDTFSVRHDCLADLNQRYEKPLIVSPDSGQFKRIVAIISTARGRLS